MSVSSPRRLARASFLVMGLTLLRLSPPLAAAPDGTASPGHVSASGGDAGTPPGRLQRIAASLAERWKARVLIDPAIAPGARPARLDPDLPIDQALDAAVAPLRRVTWRRLYLPLSPSDTLPPVEALATAARTLEQPEPGSLLLEDPAAQRVTGCLKGLAITPSMEAMARQAKLDRQPVYLIFSTMPSPEQSTSPSRIADLQRQQMELPLPPERQALAMAQMVRLLQAMPPSDRAAFASRTLAAGMRLWDSTPQAQREEMIQQSLQLMQAFGAPPDSRTAGGDGGVARPPLRSAPEAASPPRTEPPGDTRSLAAALTTRYGTPFLVDPSLLFSGPAALPAADLPAEKALAALAHRLPGAAGRRVYLPEARQKRLPSPERLAAVVRGLDEMVPFSLLIENPGRERATLYLKDQPSAFLPMLIEQGQLSERPLSLLYSRTPAARGDSVEDRVADLQRQQIGLLLRMSPEELTQAAETVIRSFPTADADTQSRLMGLPAMAGLMAVWLPRETKEREQPLVP
jgi:hypothetical protein